MIRNPLNTEELFGAYDKGADVRKSLGRLGDPRLLRPVLTWNLPALVTRHPVEGFPHPFVVCPGAGECAKWCYARVGHFIRPAVSAKHEYCLALTRAPEFEERIIAAIKGKPFVRIHSSGEFYDPQYFERWLRICTQLRGQTIFWCYTKMIQMVRDFHDLIPDNLNIIFSTGGKHDELIDFDRDRHTRVFPAGTTRGEVVKTGYAYCSNDDLIHICLRGARKIGLVAHGQKMRLVREPV